MRKPLSELQVRGIVEGLSAGRPHKEIAETIGVHRQTIASYAAKPEIRQQVESRKKEILVPKIEAIARSNQERLEEAQQWLDKTKQHQSDLEKTAKTMRIGGMNAMTKVLNAIQVFDMREAKLSELASLLRVAHDLASASYDFEARVLGIYEVMEQAHEHNKESEG